MSRKMLYPKALLSSRFCLHFLTQSKFFTFQCGQNKRSRVKIVTVFLTPFFLSQVFSAICCGVEKRTKENEINFNYEGIQLALSNNKVKRRSNRVDRWPSAHVCVKCHSIILFISLNHLRYSLIFVSIRFYRIWWRHLTLYTVLSLGFEFVPRQMFLT